MFREKLDKLTIWKDKVNRKPLIVNGARQTGKSWLVREFGKLYFRSNFVELNFEKNLEFHSIFKENLDPTRIINVLNLLTGKEIEIGKTLVFFDEIQMCPEALMSLRYFYEEIPGLHIIAAGSLLDFTFRNIPFPVGRVEFETLSPMTFIEFLIAGDNEKLADLIKNKVENIPDIVQNKIYSELMNYYVVGGMPECVKTFCETNNFKTVNEIQQGLIYSFRQDFKKYSPNVDPECLSDILDNSSKNIGNQTIYSKLSDRFSNPTIKKGVNVLATARILTKVENVGITGLPLIPSGKNFKAFFLDIGLLMNISKFDYHSAYINKSLIGAFEGALAEQFVAQQLLSYKGDLNYWARTKPGSSSEVDFVIIENKEIVPIEVKAGKKGSLKSLHYLLEHHKNINKAVVYGKIKSGKTDKIIFQPIYFAGL